MAVVALPLSDPVNPAVEIVDPVIPNPLGKSIVPEMYDADTAVSAVNALPLRDPVIPAYTERECNLCIY